MWGGTVAALLLLVMLCMHSGYIPAMADCLKLLCWQDTNTLLLVVSPLACQALLWISGPARNSAAASGQEHKTAAVMLIFEIGLFCQQGGGLCLPTW